MSEFAAPAAAGGGLAVADAEGHLLIITPVEYVASIATKFGDKDAIRVDLVDLDTGEEWPDSLWFGGFLVGSLKRSIGTKVLARVRQGQAQAGMSPPWLLEDATGDADAVAKATEWQRQAAARSLTAPVQPDALI